MLSWMPQNVATFGGQVDGVILLIFRIVGVWFLLAMGTLLYFAIRYRHREGRRAMYVPGRTRRSLLFVLVPAALVLCFDLAIDAASTHAWNAIKIDMPPAGQIIRVTGKQYVWTFRHPGPDGALDTADDVLLDNELHVPAGTIVEFELQAEDVIHSFFVPNLRLKQDAVPGRNIHGWFEATRPGRYQIVCAELCGIGHTNMRGWLEVQTPEAYQAWLREQSASPQWD